MPDPAGAPKRDLRVRLGVEVADGEGGPAGREVDPAQADAVERSTGPSPNRAATWATPLAAVGTRSLPRRTLSEARTNTTTRSRFARSLPATSVSRVTISARRANFALLRRMPRVTFTASPSSSGLVKLPGLWRGSLVSGAKAMASAGRAAETGRTRDPRPRETQGGRRPELLPDAVAVP